MRQPSSVFATAEAAEEAFYDAMQRGDLEAMMGLWADDEDVACAHPNGTRLVGLPAIRASFETIFAGGGVHIRISDVRIHQGAAIAVHNLVEQLLVSGRGGTQVVPCVATNVYVKTVRGWRIVLHHASPIGEGGGDPQPAHVPPAVLH